MESRTSSPVAVIVQARMGSSRLPGKVMRLLGGRPLLAHLVARLRACRRMDEIVIATTEDERDRVIAAEADRLEVACFRGSEEDVLSRYVGAARMTAAAAVVRVTADCPLLDPAVVDSVIDRLIESGADYASNTIRRTFPRGLDVEAFPLETLARLDRAAEPGPAREHVTWLVHRMPGELRLASVEDQEDNSDLRWTVDTDDDWTLIERLFRELDLARAIAPYRAILDHVRAHPELTRINGHVEQKRG